MLALPGPGQGTSLHPAPALAAGIAGPQRDTSVRLDRTGEEQGTVGKNRETEFQKYGNMETLFPKKHPAYVRH